MDRIYTLLDHTADLRIRVTGADPADSAYNVGGGRGGSKWTSP